VCERERESLRHKKNEIERAEKTKQYKEMGKEKIRERRNKEIKKRTR
jgi:hypothetical protein